MVSRSGGLDADPRQPLTMEAYSGSGCVATIENAKSGKGRRYLSAFAWCFVAARVVPGVAVELRPAGRRIFAARGHGAMVALAIIEAMVDMAVEIARPVIPGSGADEYSA